MLDRVADASRRRRRRKPRRMTHDVIRLKPTVAVTLDAHFPGVHPRKAGKISCPRGDRVVRAPPWVAHPVIDVRHEDEIAVAGIPGHMSPSTARQHRLQESV